MTKVLYRYILSALLTLVAKPALRALLDVILSVWTSRDHINYSFLSRHRCK